jgi:HlyD family type I secretion membrane fusion protein
MVSPPDGKAPARKVSDSPWTSIWIGIVIVGVFFGGFGAWAALAPFASAVVAPAYVRVESNRKTIQHLEGGIVREIAVKEGQRVQRGQVLIRLDDTQVKAAHEVLLSQFDGLRAQEARLLAERDNSEIEFPADLLQRQDKHEVGKILDGERSQFRVRRSSLEGQISILQQRIAQIKEQIAGVEAQLASQRRQLVLINDELKDTRHLYESGNTTLIRVRQLERTQAALEGQGGEYMATLGRLKEQIGESERQIIQAENDRQAAIARDLRDVQSRVADIIPRLQAAKNTLDRTDISAPDPGFVVGLSTFTIGGVVRPSDPLMQIVPDRDLLVLEAQVRVEDIDQLRPGLEAQVHLTAFRDRLTPTVEGIVTKVSADRLMDQRTGAPYYLMDVAIKPDELSPERRKALYPGMPAQVIVPFGERSALDYLIRPLSDSMIQAFREK